MVNVLLHVLNVPKLLQGDSFEDFFFYWYPCKIQKMLRYEGYSREFHYNCIAFLGGMLNIRLSSKGHNMLHCLAEFRAYFPVLQTSSARHGSGGLQRTYRFSKAIRDRWVVTGVQPPAWSWVSWASQDTADQDSKLKSPTTVLFTVKYRQLRQGERGRGKRDKTNKNVKNFYF